MVCKESDGLARQQVVFEFLQSKENFQSLNFAYGILPFSSVHRKTSALNGTQYTTIIFWVKNTPTANEESSVLTINGLKGTGNVKTGGLIKAFLKLTSDEDIGSDQEMMVLGMVWACKGATSFVDPFMNLQQ